MKFTHTRTSLPTHDTTHTHNLVFGSSVWFWSHYFRPGGFWLGFIYSWGVRNFFFISSRVFCLLTALHRLLPLFVLRFVHC